MIGEDVLFLPAVELAQRLDAGSVTSVELTDAYLTRIARVAPSLNCFITVTPERARADAAAADAARAAGQRGPLLGLPYALKDLVDTAGIATTWGAKPLQDRVPERDARVEAKLREAGGVLLGKLSMTELANAFGSGMHERNHNGACRNPWDRARWAGGSSSGSGSATAAGLCAFAIGSETWGSIDCPASYCGVTGLRPTYDLVSRDGCMAISWTMDKIGVLARDARDTALVLGVIAEQPLDASREALRVAFVDNPKVSPDPAYPAAWEAAKRTIAAIPGVTASSLTLPPIARLGAGVTVLLAEREVAFDDFIRTGKLLELYDAEGAKKDRVDYPALGLRAEDYVRAMAIRTLLQRAYRDIFANVDVIVAPGRPEIAPLVSDKYKENPENPSDDLNTDGNLCGLPQVTAPMGFTASGLPVSLAAVAAPYRDAMALDLVARFQASTDFHRRRPRDA